MALRVWRVVRRLYLWQGLREDAGGEVRDAEIAQRANLHADNVWDELSLPERIVLRKYQERVRTIIARTFVIGFAAGVEDATLPRRRR